MDRVDRYYHNPNTIMVSHTLKDTIDDRSRADAKGNKCIFAIYKLVTHPFFNFLIFLLIIGNMVLLTMDDHYNTKAKEK